MGMYYNLIASMSRGIAPTNPLWNGLLAYYTADNTPNDALGTYNGTLVNGATYGTGIINQGFSFDGVNDYVDLGNVLDFEVNTPFSINLWEDVSSGTNNNCFFSKLSVTPFKGYVFRRLFGATSSKIQLQMSSDSLNYFQYTTVNNYTYPMNMVTVTYDGLNSSSSVKIYVNGVSQSVTRTTTGTGATSISNTGVAKIGSNSFGGGSDFFNGVLDEVGIWNRVLTPTEVTELYNAGAGKQYPN